MNARFRHIAGITAKIYAALVLLWGLGLAFLAAIMFAAMHIGDERAGTTMYVLIPGLIFAALSAFVWRGKIWAMIVAAALALGYVLFAAGQDASYLALLAIPVIFGIFAAVNIWAGSTAGAR